MKKYVKRRKQEEQLLVFGSEDLFDLRETVKNEFARVREVYRVLCLLAAILVFLMENGMLLVFLRDPEAYGGFQTSIPVYVLQYNVVPSVLNFAAAAVPWIVRKKKFRSEFVQNSIPVAAMGVICMVTATVHSIYPIVMCVVGLPVFMASIFSNRKLILLTACYGLPGIVFATVWRALSPYTPSRLFLVPEAITALLILVLATILSLVLSQMFSAQRRRLIRAVKIAEEAKMDAQTANQTKSEFLANMSHEIRTPLNAIIGSTEILSRRSSDPVAMECASNIQQSGNFLLSIINDILDISKIESGNMEVEESQYELGSLINDSYNMVEARGRDKGLSMEVVCDPLLPHTLIGDAYHLRQVVVNLLTNAVKYTNAGRVELNVSGRREGETLQLTIQVKDTGIGIRKEDQAHLFEKFNRVDLKQNRRIEGTGLGLSITRQLVTLMNGTVGVESAYGLGSVFTVVVPQRIADDAPVGDIHLNYLSDAPEEEYHHSFEAPEARVLAVDDVPMNLQVICRLLEETKLQIDTAASGAECLKLVQEKHYDLILMDQMMPQMDGTETLHAMWELPDPLNRETPVIMLTANAMVGAREGYLEAGFTDYLSKPVRGARLEAMIQKYLPPEKVKKTV